MPARDVIHYAVRNALEKDGWTITEDPFVIVYKEVTLFADLGAEHPLGARRGNEKIVVEAKSFSGPSTMRDLECTLGQFLIYRTYLNMTHPGIEVLLAVSRTVFEAVFQMEAVDLIVQEFQIKLLVVDVDREEFVP